MTPPSHAAEADMAQVPAGVSSSRLCVFCSRLGLWLLSLPLKLDSQDQLTFTQKGREWTLLGTPTQPSDLSQHDGCEPHSLIPYRHDWMPCCWHHDS